MKLVYLAIIRNNLGPKQSVILASEAKLDEYGYFQRKGITEYLVMFSKTVAEGTSPGQRQEITQKEFEGFRIHAYGRSEGICGIAVTDDDYPSLAAQRILGKIVDEFLTENPRSAWANDMPHAELPQLKDYINDFQDPKKVDNITQIQAQLDETKDVLHKTIESVLQRGESLDTLVSKSEDLSFASKSFNKSAGNMNRCCTLM